MWLPSLMRMWGDYRRVKGHTGWRGRGFRTPCCVINNLLDSMYSPLSSFPKKATVWVCSAQKIQIKPQSPADNDPQTTHTHSVTHVRQPATDKTQASHSYLHPPLPSDKWCDRVNMHLTLGSVSVLYEWAIQIHVWQTFVVIKSFIS